MAKIRVVVVDDSALVRSLLSEIINRQRDMECIGTANDPLVAREIFAILREIHQQGMTVLLVEQNVRQALKLADRAYVLETLAQIATRYDTLPDAALPRPGLMKRLFGGIDKNA